MILRAVDTSAARVERCAAQRAGGHHHGREAATMEAMAAVSDFDGLAALQCLVANGTLRIRVVGL